MNVDVTPIAIPNLFRIETYTDQAAGTIFRQIPVLESGERDPMRREAFGGSCHILVGGRPMPINFPIEGSSLAEAIENFPDAVKNCLQSMQDAALKQKILEPGPGPGPSAPRLFRQ